MNIVQTSRAIRLSIGLIAASVVLVPMVASAATLYATGVDRIYKFASDVSKTTFATGLSGTAGLAFDFSAGSSSAVPEPFTIIGTLISGTAALRMRKKLKSSGKV
jgi:hypothetical protein